MNKANKRYSFDVFLSYSRRDLAFALNLFESLVAAGLRVWMDCKQLPYGQPWDDQINEALPLCETMVLVHSEASNRSQNVKDEWAYFRNTGNPIIPVIIEKCALHFRLARFHHIDFTKQAYEDAIEALINALVCKPEPTPTDEANFAKSNSRSSDTEQNKKTVKHHFNQKNDLFTKRSHYDDKLEIVMTNLLNANPSFADETAEMTAFPTDQLEDEEILSSPVQSQFYHDDNDDIALINEDENLSPDIKGRTIYISYLPNPIDRSSDHDSASEDLERKNQYQAFLLSYWDALLDFDPPTNSEEQQEDKKETQAFVFDNRSIDSEFDRNLTIQMETIPIDLARYQLPNRMKQLETNNSYNIFIDNFQVSSLGNWQSSIDAVLIMSNHSYIAGNKFGSKQPSFHLDGTRYDGMARKRVRDKAAINRFINSSTTPIPVKDRQWHRGQYIHLPDYDIGLYPHIIDTIYHVTEEAFRRKDEVY
jgi:hypothetical protein